MFNFNNKTIIVLLGLFVFLGMSACFSGVKAYSLCTYRSCEYSNATLPCQCGTATAEAGQTPYCCAAGNIVTASKTDCENYCIAAITTAPTLNLSISSSSINSGSSAILTWSSTGATSCSASSSPANSQWTGNKILSSSQTVTDLSAVTVFTLICSGAGGSVTKNVTVNISGSCSSNSNCSNGMTCIDGACGCGSAGVTCSSDKTCVNGACSSASTTTTTTNCDSTFYSSYSQAYDFSTASGSKTGLCGSEQFYKITIPSGKTCDLQWALQPDSNSDYDLYVRWDSTVFSRNSNYGERSINGKGQKDAFAKTSLSAGTYYAMAYKESGTTGSYTFTANLTNCSGSQSGSSEISVSLNQSSGSVTQNSTLSPSPVANINIPSTFTQSVSITLSGQPSGVTATLSPDSSCSATCSKIINISAPSTTSTGTYPITITAIGGGQTKTAVYNLTVVATGATTTTTTNSDTQTQLTQLKAQITQLIAQINQLQIELTAIKTGTGNSGITTTNTQNNLLPWCYTFTTNMKYLDRGYSVGALQAALQKEGLYGGVIGGYYAYFGKLTQSAVISFQEKYKSEILTPLGLTTGTGFVGSTTINKLNELYGCQ